jgi:hypothetical protein
MRLPPYARSSVRHDFVSLISLLRCQRLRTGGRRNELCCSLATAFAMRERAQRQAHVYETQRHAAKLLFVLRLTPLYRRHLRTPSTASACSFTPVARCREEGRSEEAMPSAGMKGGAWKGSGEEETQGMMKEVP